MMPGKSNFKMTDEQKALFDKLKPLQREIALNSLSGMNDIDAYRASSGKAKTEESMRVSVSQILTNLNVRAFLDSMKEAAVSDAVMSRQEMMERQTKLARANINDLIVWATVPHSGDDGEEITQSVWQLKAEAAQDPELLASISELSATKDGFKFKMHSPLSAMKQLAELAGYEAPKQIEITEKEELTPWDDIEINIDG